jgi:hypothetical protein
MRVAAVLSDYDWLRRSEPKTALAGVAMLGVALSIGLAVLAVAFSLGRPLLLLSVWGASTLIAVRWPFPALLTYLSLIPWAPEYVGLEVPPIMELSAPRLLGLCFLPGLLLSLVVDRPRLRVLQHPLPIAVTVFWAIVVVTPLWSRGSISLTAAIRDGFLYGLDYLLPCLVTLALIRDSSRARKLVIALAAGGAFLATFAVVEFASGSNPFVKLGPLLPQAEQWTRLDTRAGLPRVEVTFSHPLSFGRYLALLAPLVVWASASSTKRVERWWLGATAVGIAAATLLTLSAGPALTLLLGLVLTVAALRRPSLPAMAGVLAALAIFVLLLPVSSQVRETLGAWLGLETSLTALTRRNFAYRLAVFDIARYGLETSPLFGYGNRASIPVLQANQDIINTYVGQFMKHGIVGLSAFLAIILTFLRTVGRAALGDQPLRSFALVLAAAMLPQLILLLSVSPVGPGERMFWIFVGLAGALLNTGAKAASDLGNPLATSSRARLQPVL